jgi:formate dehydrogenase subunit gamma
MGRKIQRSTEAMRSMSEQVRVARFDAYERVMHWMSALSFLYAAFSGLAMWSPKLWWIGEVMGGGFVIRGTHPWSGVIFAAVIGWMFLRWAKSMRLDKMDRDWMMSMDKYITHQHDKLPPSGKFNAGQKMLFWSQVVTALLLFVTGVVLWFPEVMPRWARLASIALHPLGAIGSIGGIIVHIYMGTAAVPDSMRAILRGWVTPEWARFHHPRWWRDIKASVIGSTTGKT